MKRKGHFTSFTTLSDSGFSPAEAEMFSFLRLPSFFVLLSPPHTLPIAVPLPQQPASLSGETWGVADGGRGWEEGWNLLCGFTFSLTFHLSVGDFNNNNNNNKDVAHHQLPPLIASKQRLRLCSLCGGICVVVYIIVSVHVLYRGCTEHSTTQ